MSTKMKKQILSIGTKVEIIEDQSPFFKVGDTAIVNDCNTDIVDILYWLDFNNQGNDEVCQDGMWASAPRHFKVIENVTDRTEMKI